MYRTEQNGTKVSFISNIKPETDRYEIIHVTITTNRHANELVKNGTAHFNNDLVLFQLKGMHKKVYMTTVNMNNAGSIFRKLEYTVNKREK